MFEDVVRRELPHLGDADVADLVRTLQRLILACRPERIYLFGSQARGTASEHSDVDLMVIVADSEHPQYLRAQAALEAIGPHLVPVDIVVWTRAEFDARLPAAASLPATVLREGRTLYAA